MLGSGTGVRRNRTVTSLSVTGELGAEPEAVGRGRRTGREVTGPVSAGAARPGTCSRRLIKADALGVSATSVPPAVSTWRSGPFVVEARSSAPRETE